MDNPNDGLGPAEPSGGTEDTPTPPFTVSLSASVSGTFTIPAGLARGVIVAALFAAAVLVALLLTRLAAPAARATSSAVGATAFVPLWT